MEKVSKSIYKIDTGHKKPESTLFHITKLTPAPVATQIERQIEEDVINLFPENSTE